MPAMKDEHKTKAELIRELNELRGRMDSAEWPESMRLSHLREFVEGSPIPTAVGGNDGSILALNHAMTDLIGYKKSEMATVSDWAARLYPDAADRALAWRSIEQALKGERHDITEFVITCKDGTKKTVEFHISFFEHGLIVQTVDITERRDAVAALRASEAKWRSLVEHAPDMIMIVEPDGTIAFMNHTIAGMTVEDVVGKNVREFLDPDSLGPQREAFKAVFERGETSSYEARGPGVGGMPGYYATKVGPVREDGEVTAALQIVRDTTARKQTETRLRRTMDELMNAEKLAAVGQIAAEITHEINQPLTAMQTYADNAIALAAAGRYEEVCANLATISELLARAAEIATQLKTLARRPVPGPPAAVSLTTVVENVCSFLAMPAAGAGCRIVTDIGPGDCRVKGSQLRLEQMLINLMGNALEAMRTSPEPRMTVRVRSGKGNVVLTCEDTGPGIPAKDRGRVFEPFFTSKQVGNGLGLGLTLCRTIAEECGGKITAGKARSGGALFKVTLPSAGPGSAESAG